MVLVLKVLNTYILTLENQTMFSWKFGHWWYAACMVWFWRCYINIRKWQIISVSFILVKSLTVSASKVILNGICRPQLKAALLVGTNGLFSLQIFTDKCHWFKSSSWWFCYGFKSRDLWNNKWIATFIHSWISRISTTGLHVNRNVSETDNLANLLYMTMMRLPLQCI